MAKRGRPGELERCICSHEWICHSVGAPCFCGCRQFKRPGGKLPKLGKRERARVMRAQMRVVE